MSKNNNHRKYVRMVRCPNCGAQYEAGLLHCPYCRSVDDYQDESEYLEDLNDLKEKMEDMPEDVIREQSRIQTKEAAGDIRKIFRWVLVMAAVFLVLMGVFTFFDKVVAGNSDKKRSEDAKEEYLWKQENFAVMDDLYEKKDYEGLLEFVRNADNFGVYDWEHYPLIEGLQILEYLPGNIRMLEELEQQDKIDDDLYLSDRAFVLKDELELLYFDHRKADPEDIRIIKEMSAEYLEDLETRFALTPEELDAFERKAAKDMGEFYISECKDFLKNR